jgi:hypothetical protein
VAQFAPAPGISAKLRTITHFDMKPDLNNEWFKLHAQQLTNKQLFQMLEAIWPAIVGPEAHRFALLHCLGGPDAGVWFHVLPNSDYEPGCHEILSF